MTKKAKNEVPDPARLIPPLRIKRRKGKSDLLYFRWPHPDGGPGKQRFYGSLNGTGVRRRECIEQAFAKFRVEYAAAASTGVSPLTSHLLAGRKAWGPIRLCLCRIESGVASVVPWLRAHAFALGVSLINQSKPSNGNLLPKESVAQNLICTNVILPRIPLDHKASNGIWSVGVRTASCIPWIAQARGRGRVSGQQCLISRSSADSRVLKPPRFRRQRPPSACLISGSLPTSPIPLRCGNPMPPGIRQAPLGSRPSNAWRNRR